MAAKKTDARLQRLRRQLEDVQTEMYFTEGRIAELQALRRRIKRAIEEIEDAEGGGCRGGRQVKDPGQEPAVVRGLDQGSRRR